MPAKGTDWSKFAKTTQPIGKAGSVRRPSVIQFFFVRAIENGLYSVLVILTAALVLAAILVPWGTSTSSYVQHLAELFVGVFLGLFTASKT